MKQLRPIEKGFKRATIVCIAISHHDQSPISTSYHHKSTPFLTPSISATALEAVVVLDGDPVLVRRATTPATT